MNVSKRTWILFGIALLGIVAAFASLYFEKEEEIKTLEEIEPEVKRTPRSKAKMEVVTEEQTIQNNEPGTVTEQK